MSKLLRIWSALLCIILVSSTFTACDSEKTPEPMQSSEGLEYQLIRSGTSYMVTGIGTCTDTDIVIDMYNGLPVVNIAPNVFKDCTNLTSVTLGSHIEIINSSAFESCTGLTSIILPDTIKEIGIDAFYNCSSLTSVTLPDSTTYFGRNAFTGTPYYDEQYSNEANWDRNVFYIENYLIKANDDLSGEYDIRKGTTTIAMQAFENCTELTNITIPNSVTSISTQAFWGCSGLTSISIPDSVTSIGDGPFFNCSSLANIAVDEENSAYKSINGNLYSKDEKNFVSYAYGKPNNNFDIPNSVTSISHLAFYGCTTLTNITIPDSVTSIGGSAFSGCTGLVDITIPDSVTSIGVSAFSGCTGLIDITIPDGVTSIGSRAFRHCSSLTDIYFTGTEEEWNAIEGLADAEIPETTTLHYNHNS